MSDTVLTPEVYAAHPATRSAACRLAVIWIDWYPYHVARFRGLLADPSLAGRIAGIELVGGVGVHAGLKFREPLPPGLPVVTLRPQDNWQSTGKLLLACELWGALSRLDPLAVLVPGYYTLPGIAAALWARLHGRRSILMSESTEDDHLRSPWRERAKAFLLRTLFDSAVVGGALHRRYLARLGFPLDRVAGCYDVVDNRGIADSVAAQRARAAADASTTPCFLYVGRLAPEKNVVGLVRAWLSYREGGGTWSLVLAGDGPERATITAELAASPHAADVVLTGLRTASELIPLWAAAACFVLPSTREPWGLVVNEAMAASLPVLVSQRCGAAADLVREGENGFTFDPLAGPGHPAMTSAEPGDLVSLLHRMERLPPLTRRRMGARSAELIRDISPECFGKEVARLLHD